MDDRCTVSEWTDWSPCSASCGTGLKYRSRQLIVSGELKDICAGRVELAQQRICTLQADCSVDRASAKRKLWKKYINWKYNFITEDVLFQKFVWWNRKSGLAEDFSNVGTSIPGKGNASLSLTADAGETGIILNLNRNVIKLVLQSEASILIFAKLALRPK